MNDLQELELQLGPHLRRVLDTIIPTDPVAFAESDPVTSAATTPDVEPTAAISVRGDNQPKLPSRRLVASAAIVIAATGLAGVVAIANRTKEVSPGTAPPASTPTITSPEISGTETDGASSMVANTVADETAPTADTAPATTTTPLGDTELAAALKPDGTVLVVNAAAEPGLAALLTRALELSGYDVVEPVNAADGVILDNSVIYTHPDAPPGMTVPLAEALPVSRGEELFGQPTPGLTADLLDRADTIIVLGRDLADAPWQNRAPPLVQPGIGVLLVVDATGTPAGRTRANERAQALRDLGVDVSGVVAGSRTVEESMLMPIGPSTLWTFAVADLAGIGGFDTWMPSLIADPLPQDVSAVLVIGETAQRGS